MEADNQVNQLNQNESSPISPFERFALNDVVQGLTGENPALGINITASGTRTIQQTQRNDLRQRGESALKQTLEQAFGGRDVVEIVKTQNGLCLVIEAGPDTVTLELKTAIKSLDYDPFIEASAYDEQREQKEAKRCARKQAQLAHEAAIQAKRAEKLAALAALSRKDGASGDNDDD